MTSSRFGALICAVVFACHSDNALAEFGRTQGAFAVSGGSATYTIPVWTPPGPNGMTPSIAITYNSASGNGVGGVGWNISAVSSIERCNRTAPQDGNGAPILLTMADKFCIGGNRLRLQSGTYGAATSVYYTELADYSRITANGVVGNGPMSFTVEAKSGLKYEYGGVTDSRVVLGGTVMRWMLNKVYDRNGNNYIISYDNANGTASPNTISWTPTYLGSTAYRYEARFNYSTKTAVDSITGKVAGIDVTNDRRLENIQIKSNGVVVRKYYFGYGTSGQTNRSLLTSAKECADDTVNNCLLPITFQYQAGSSGVAGTPISGISSSSLLSLDKYDFNGDGKSDLLYVSGSNWYVSFATGTGFTAGVDTGVSSSATYHAQRFLATQQDGLLVNVGNVWKYYSYNGSAFVSQLTGTAVDNGTITTDNNGDGLADLVWTSGGNVMLRLNTSASAASVPSFATSAVVAASFSVGQGNVGIINSNQCPFNRMCDINGDGRADLMVNVHSATGCGINGCSHSDAKFDLYAIDGGYGVGPQVGAVGYRGMKFNDDRCIDRVPNAAPTTLEISSCTGIFTTVALPASGGLFMDWNGDNRTDIVVSNGGFFGVYLSTGKAATPFSSIQSTTIPISSSCLYFILDADGDGLDDLGCVGATSPYAVSYFPRNGSGGIYLTQEPDLLSSATDGYGVNSSPSYVSTAQNNYTRGTATQLPLYDATDPITVVAQVVSSDGTNGTYTKTYSYFGARNNIPRAESAGFQRIDEVDNRNNIITRTYFDQLFPLAGMVNQLEVMQPGGVKTISRVVNANIPNQIDPTSLNQRYFPFAQTSTATTFEVGGSWDGNLLRTVVTSNVVDNPTGTLYDETVVTTEPASGANGINAGATWTARTYSPLADFVSNSTTWCLGRPGKTQQINSHSLSYGSSLTRTSRMYWNTTLCRPTQAVDESSIGVTQVTTDIGYDSYGNVNSTTVTGAGMTARTTTTSYSDVSNTTGQFPLSSTNALAQVSTSAWNYDLGVPTSATDSNGITTSWLYDAFGRRTRETLPDSTYTTWNYVQFSSGEPRVRLYLDQRKYSSTGTLITIDELHMDQFERAIQEYHRRPDLDWNVVFRKFDALGRLEKETFPFIYSVGGGYWSNFYYDTANRVTQVTRQVGEANGTLQSSLVSYEGLSTRTTDAEGKIAIKISNANDELARSVDHDGYYQGFLYDAFGAPRLVSDSAGNPLQVSDYNDRGMLTSRTDLDMGSWGFTPNALGEVVSQTDANGQTTTFTFDKLGRLTDRTESEGTSTWTWGVSSAAKNIGRLSSVTGPGYSESYVYDSIGRRANVTISADTTYQIDYTYNSIGALDTLTYPASTSAYRLKLQYQYQYGYLYRIQDFNSPGTNFWTADTFNARDQITQETLGNGLRTNRSYDLVTGGLKWIQTGLSGGSGVQNLAYEWDRVGNLKKRRDNNQSGLEEVFSYDNLHRLDYSTLNGVQNLNVDYDALGNITNKSDVGAYSYHASKKHQVSSTSNGWTFGYDNNGNMTTGRGATITWTSYNYPASIANGSDTSTFNYTPNRQYWKQVSAYSSGGSATTVYIGGILEKVSTSGGTEYRHTIRAGGANIIVSRQTSGTNSIHYVTSDHLGSSSAITNSAGGILVNSSFDSFGKRRGSNWAGNPSGGDWSAIASTTRHGFTDHTMLDNLGLTHMNGRIYDQAIGRFMSADPLVSDPGNTQNFNRYGYVYNNPLTTTDPSGFETCRVGSLCNPDDQLLDQIARTIANACMANAQCAAMASAAASSGNIDGFAGLAVQGLNIRDFIGAGTNSPNGNLAGASSNGNGAGAASQGIDSSNDILVTGYRSKPDFNNVSGGCASGYAVMCHQAPVPFPPSVQAIFSGVDAVMDFLDARCESKLGDTKIACNGGTAPIFGPIRAAQAVKGAATILQHEGRHVSILVRSGEKTLHTHQVIVAGDKTVIAAAQGLRPVVGSVTVELPNAAAALRYQQAMMGRGTGAYDFATNSCLTHCAAVLRAGGLEGIPSSTRELIKWVSSLGL